MQSIPSMIQAKLSGSHAGSGSPKLRGGGGAKQLPLFSFEASTRNKVHVVSVIYLRLYWALADSRFGVRSDQ